MAPAHSKQLLIWSFPTIALLLSYLWYRRKRLEAKTDPGDNHATKVDAPTLDLTTIDNSTIVNIRTKTEAKDINVTTTEKAFSRSLSGVETSPIDIIIPRELRTHKNNQPIISDEDLDFEIEKIKSMKAPIVEEAKSVEPAAAAAATAAVVTESFEVVVKTSPNHSPVKQNLSDCVDSAVKPLNGSKQQRRSNGKPTKQQETVGRKHSAKKNSENKSAAQKEVEEIQQKFDEMKLRDKTPIKADNRRKHNQLVQQQPNEDSDRNSRRSTERDSANHSPADVMLASPSLSCISDNHSEGSNDSGKGCSEVATPPSRTPACDGSISGDGTLPILYEFVIPQEFVGRLIGTKGKFLGEIRSKTHAHVNVIKHSADNIKICVLEGMQLEVNNALHLIRKKFPLKRYPSVTLERIIVEGVPNVPFVPEQLYLKLVEGVNNDTVVSCMVSPGHLYLQQPGHPSYPGLNILAGCMAICYNTGAEAPILPTPIQPNTICVAPSLGQWYRAIVVGVDTASNASYVCFLDVGGYAWLDNSLLKQIRGDFMMLPFQASETMLADIHPAGGEEASWCDQAYSETAELIKGAITYTQIVDYTSDSVPLVYIYILCGEQVVFLNEELVKRGFAEWREQSSDSVASTSTTTLESPAADLVTV